MDELILSLVLSLSSHIDSIRIDSKAETKFAQSLVVGPGFPMACSLHLTSLHLDMSQGWPNDVFEPIKSVYASFEASKQSLSTVCLFRTDLLFDTDGLVTM